MKVKTILLQFEPVYFYRFKTHKNELEAKDGKSMTWEDYFIYLFGLRGKK